MRQQGAAAVLFVVLAGGGCGSTPSAVAPDGAAGAPGGTGGASDGAAGGSGGMDGAGGAPECGPPSPAPGAVHDGDVSIRDAASAAAARGYTEITGTLRVLPELAGELSLPNLVEVGGDLIVEGVASPLTESRITRLDLPNLTRIGGDLWLYLNFSLVETDFWKLARIGGRLYVHRNTVLVKLGLDSLGEVGATTTMEITGNPRLPKCLVDAVYSAVGWPGPSSSNGDATIPCETICGRTVTAGL